MPNTLRRAAALLIGAVLAAAVHAVDTGPRGHVDAVADAIADHYFDAARGQRIADDLRRDADAGRFDALQDPVALADDLTARLRPLDRHFRVRWSADGDAPIAGAPGPRRPMEPSTSGGIVKVEVLPGNIGYLQLDQFAHFDFDDAQAPARKAIDAALAQLSATDSMIVDVRNNHGGSPHMVGYLVSAFVAASADPYNRFHTRTRTFSEAPAKRYAHPRTDVPLYVLINAKTGSAAESFAYTLKSAGRATVIGQPSAGAANPGGIIDIGDGFSVFVSNGTPINPNTGGNWEATGVAPDVAVAPETALDVALLRARKNG